MPEPTADLVEAFLARWSASGGHERANYQLFLVELCDLLGVPRPDPARPENAANAYVFERSVTRAKPDGTATTNYLDLYRCEGAGFEGLFPTKAKAWPAGDCGTEGFSGHGPCPPDFERFGSEFL